MPIFNMVKVNVLFLSIFAILQNVTCSIEFSRNGLLLGVNETLQFNVTVTNFNRTDVQLFFNVQQEDILRITPNVIFLELGNKTYNFIVEGVGAGHSDVIITSNSDIDLSQLHLTGSVYKYKYVDILSQVVGWIFILSWGSSFYPQIYTNFQRKCVVGLNFDYLALNIIGYISFGAFILNLFFNSEVQGEYFERYPRGLIPVKLNDVVYNLHGTMAILFTISQCCIYDRGDQKVSTTAKLLICLIVVFYTVCTLLQRLSILERLDFLYYCSYVKLAVTLLKYVPQAYMNYKRKSTHGWSIGLVFLDLNGGMFSILQMVFDAYNYDDWFSIFGNPTKFILGILTIMFHSFFVIQHYVLYKRTNYKFIP